MPKNEDFLRTATGCATSSRAQGLTLLLQYNQKFKRKIANAQPETEGPKEKEEKRPSVFEKVRNRVLKGANSQSGQNVPSSLPSAGDWAQRLTHVRQVFYHWATPQPRTESLNLSEDYSSVLQWGWTHHKLHLARTKGEGKHTVVKYPPTKKISSHWQGLAWIKTNSFRGDSKLEVHKLINIWT